MVTKLISSTRCLISLKFIFVFTIFMILSTCWISENLSYAQTTLSPRTGTGTSELFIWPALIASTAGVITASLGIYTYWLGQNLKRKEIRKCSLQRLF